MASNFKLKTGDKIVQFGKAYRVCKIEKRKNSSGKTERIIFFKPFFKRNKSHSLICSIPERNARGAKIRLPITTKDAKELLRKLSENIKGTRGVADLNELKDLLNENNQKKNVTILRRLWAEKNKPETNFTYGRRKVYEETIEKLSQEIALVLKIKLEEAEKRVTKAIESSSK